MGPAALPSPSLGGEGPIALVLVLAIIDRFVIPGGNDVIAGEPAIEVDIGAALGAEGLMIFHRRLAANGAFLLRGLRHQTPDRLD